MQPFPKKYRFLLLFTAIVSMLPAFSQNVSCNLTFTALDNADHVSLDSIKVMNRTQGSETVIYWPDTNISAQITPGDELLAIGYMTRYPVGTAENLPVEEKFRVFQNVPNPVKDESTITIRIPERGALTLNVSDFRGESLIKSTMSLERGTHLFRFTPGSGNFFILSARWHGLEQHIKILTARTPSGHMPSLSYSGNGCEPFILKPVSARQGLVKESGIVVTPDISGTYTFQFATNIACPGLPAVTYEGQVYHTIQVLSQCWLQENLNVGTIIQGYNDMTNNGVTEKYCYGDNPANCGIYGGLYMWKETMQYTSLHGAQGICPQGWHIPSDEEWKVLEGAVDSLYGIGDPKWDDKGLNGFNTGLNLKSTSGWSFNGNGTDLFGFKGLPGGDRYESGGFGNAGYMGYWWSSSESIDDLAWNRNLNYSNPAAGRYDTFQRGSCSVRCVRNY